MRSYIKNVLFSKLIQTENRIKKKNFNYHLSTPALLYTPPFGKIIYQRTRESSSISERSEGSPISFAVFRIHVKSFLCLSTSFRKEFNSGGFCLDVLQNVWKKRVRKMFKKLNYSSYNH